MNSGDSLEVPVSPLRAKLTAYLQRAAAGERFTVTDRARPVAVLGPPVGQVDLLAATDASWLTPAVSPTLTPIRRHCAVRSVDDVSEDRAE